ncbi:hypothetical protein [Lentzea waywayandensis]|uniref:hypothetical protein n=1 Tax=Lentzea waywayandensis TaxID=84724 RepID=UPI00116043D6|nr:hypothetical protein [Lentzea waywayandensis]
MALIIGAGSATAWDLMAEESSWTPQWPAVIGFGIGLLYGHIARWFWLSRWLHRLPVLAVAITVCGHAPLRAQRFLRFAADRSLLVEAAGEFRFVHALVQEHLAGCDPEELTGRIR